MPDDPKPKSPNPYAQAESMLQLGLAIPAGCFAGLIVGYFIDRHFHIHWATITGLFLGAAGGFINLFTTLSRMNKRGNP
jgi:ATP synthase protein I